MRGGMGWRASGATAAAVAVAVSVMAAGMEGAKAQLRQQRPEAYVEFVNFDSGPIQVVPASHPDQPLFTVTPGKSMGRRVPVGDVFCARNLIMGRGELFDCQRLATPDSRVMSFKPPEDLCGFDVDFGYCMVPLHRGMRYVMLRMRTSNLPEAIGMREDVENVRYMHNQKHPPNVPHFTPNGTGLRRLPKKVFLDVYKFFRENFHRQVPEVWGQDSPYVNQWDAISFFIHLTPDLKEYLYNELRPIIQDWVNQPTWVLDSMSVYGIRVYTRNAQLRPHVDRIHTHVLSGIVNIASEFEHDWPLEVIHHDQLYRRYTMNPGDIIMYESASIPHGRPFLFDGSYYANVFVHFRPKNQWNVTSFQPPPPFGCPRCTKFHNFGLEMYHSADRLKPFDANVKKWD